MISLGGRRVGVSGLVGGEDGAGFGDTAATDLLGVVVETPLLGLFDEG